MGKRFISTIALAGSLWLAGCSDRNDSAAGTGSAMPETITGSGSSRDPEAEVLTPGDEGLSPADRELTRRIRRAINQNDQLSTTATNVKIITTNGKVTLSGPVNSRTERAQIAALARVATSSATIDNQLEVKQMTAQTPGERK